MRSRACLQLSSPSATPAQAFLVTVGAAGPALCTVLRPLHVGCLQADGAATPTPVHQREHSLRGRVSRSAKPQNPAKSATAELTAVIVPDGYLLRQHLPPPSTQPEFLWNCVLTKLLLICQQWVAGPLPPEQLLFRSSLLCMFHSRPVTPIICPQ